jgi:hypothetical protein
VKFTIDVFGKRWIFQKLARTISGQAQFELAANSPLRITSIDGKLE